MQAIIERCCGLDVHQETVVACVLVGAPGAQPTKEVRTFGAVTRDLEALRDWLKEAGATHVGMESTGVYWPTTATLGATIRRWKALFVPFPEPIIPGPFTR